MKKIICPQCGSKLGYVRLNGKQWVCRSCGAVTYIGKIIEKVNQPKEDVEDVVIKEEPPHKKYLGENENGMQEL